ncbi:MAG: hypothetical protein Q8N84_00260 [bacterium]|nr:hypothetical protein [bacterium]
MDVSTRLRQVFSKIDIPIFFFTNDAKVALGLEKVIPSYHIVCIDDNPIIDYLIDDGVKVYCYERAVGKKNCLFRSSSQLVAQPAVQKYLEQEAPSGKLAALLFKPCGNPFVKFSKFEVTLLNNSPAINWPLENKIEFFQKFRTEFPFPQGEIARLGTVTFEDLVKSYGPKLVFQFGRGWAGNSTFFIDKESDFVRLQSQSPERLVKVSSFVVAQTAINNACLTNGKTLISPPFKQVTGLPEYTPYAGGTCGNNWAGEDFSGEISEKTIRLTEKLGEKMNRIGYRGIFGLDFLITAEGEALISENNARMTASVPMFTKLELSAERVPLLAWHIMEFLGVDAQAEGLAIPEGNLGPVSGGQLILRNTDIETQEVGREVTPGVYHQKENDSSSWEFLRAGYSVDDLKSAKEYLVLPAAKGRRVAHGIEYLRIQSLAPILGSDGHLMPVLKDLAELMRGKMLL